MIFDFKPYKSLGPLEFFMTREQVRQTLPWDHLEMPTAAGSKDKFTDLFDDKLFVCYDQNSKCIAFELNLELNLYPNIGKETIEIFWNGVNLSNMNYHDLLIYSQSLDDAVVIGAESFDSLKYGYGGWCPDYVDDKLAKSRSLIFFTRGYRD